MRKRLCPAGPAHTGAGAEAPSRYHRGVGTERRRGRDGGGGGGVRVGAVREAGGARVPGTAEGLQPRLQVGLAPVRGVSAPPGVGGSSPPCGVCGGPLLVRCVVFVVPRRCLGSVPPRGHQELPLAGSSPSVRNLSPPWVFSAPHEAFLPPSPQGCLHPTVCFGVPTPSVPSQSLSWHSRLSLTQLWLWKLRGTGTETSRAALACSPPKRCSCFGVKGDIL